MRSLKNKKKKDRHGYLVVDTKDKLSRYILYLAEFKNKKCVDVLFHYFYDSNFDLYGKKISKSEFNKVKEHIITQCINHKSNYSFLDLKSFRFITNK